MHSGPLIPANGHLVREVQPVYPIELNRQMGSGIDCGQDEGMSVAAMPDSA